MFKFIVPLAMLALSACVSVPVGPYGGGYGGPAVQVQPDEYDLPAHCIYDAYGQILCR